MTEWERLAFVEARDGTDGMLEFAEQTLAVYIQDSIKRGPYEESIKTCITALTQNRRKVRIVVVEKP